MLLIQKGDDNNRRRDSTCLSPAVAGFVSGWMVSDPIETSAHEPAPAATPSLFISGGPERLFKLNGLEELTRETCVASIPASKWLTLPAGTTAEAGSIGVLVDVTLGYLVNASGRCWSVSTEVSIDFAQPIETGLGSLTCSARVLHNDAAGALVAGTVTTQTGSAMAHCTMRGRYLRADLPEPERTNVGAERTTSEPDRTSLTSLLGQEVQSIPSGLTVLVSDRLTNPRGMLHGGIVVTLLERAAAEAVPAPFLTASLRIQLVRGVPLNALLTVTAHVLHLGRTLSVIRVLMQDQTGRTCATATVTRHTTPNRLA